MRLPIEVSARHVHLSKKDLEILFGKNYQLKLAKKLSQPNQFAAEEAVVIKSSKNFIERIRIVGPIRLQTQVEITLSDCRHLGINAPVKVSGDLEDSAGKIILQGSRGEINLEKGAIVAQRHLHIEPELASNLKLKNGSLISIKTRGARSLVFNNVIVRSRENEDSLSFQLDTDEANAAGVKSGDFGELL